MRPPLRHATVCISFIFATVACTSASDSHQRCETGSTCERDVDASGGSAAASGGSTGRADSGVSQPEAGLTQRDGGHEGGDGAPAVLWGTEAAIALAQAAEEWGREYCSLVHQCSCTSSVLSLFDLESCATAAASFWIDGTFSPDRHLRPPPTPYPPPPTYSVLVVDESCIEQHLEFIRTVNCSDWDGAAKMYPVCSPYYGNHGIDEPCVS